MVGPVYPTIRLNLVMAYILCSGDKIVPPSATSVSGDKILPPSASPLPKSKERSTEYVFFLIDLTRSVRLTLFPSFLDISIKSEVHCIHASLFFSLYVHVLVTLFLFIMLLLPGFWQFLRCPA